jgi:hypothetical protein
MAPGRQRSEALKGREQWRQERPGQVELPRPELVTGVRTMIVSIEEPHDGGGTETDNRPSQT